MADMTCMLLHMMADLNTVTQMLPIVDMTCA